MGDESGGIPLKGALAELPDLSAALIYRLVERRDHDLFVRLRSSDEIAMDDRMLIEKALADELIPEFHGPDWEPTQYALEIEDAIEAFIIRYPIEHSAQEPPE